MPTEINRSNRTNGISLRRIIVIPKSIFIDGKLAEEYGYWDDTAYIQALNEIETTAQIDLFVTMLTPELKHYTVREHRFTASHWHCI